MQATLLARSSLRFFGRHPWQLILAITGIALGVAVFAGIQLANDSARRAFEASSAAVGREATHRLLPVAGWLDEARYLELKHDRRFIGSAPVIEVPATLLTADGRTQSVTFTGIDPIEELSLRGLGAIAGSSIEVSRLIAEPDTIVMPRGIAARLGLAAGDELELATAAQVRRVRIIGLIDSAALADSTVVADIATAQDIAGLKGQLSRVDLHLDAEAEAALASALPDATVLVPAGSRNETLGEMTRAFNTNLSALGLLALLVGMFLIYSTISFTIVQRWRSLALLRAVGLNRRELLTTLLGEAFAIGAVGTLAGLALGHLLSAGLLELVLRTLDDLYFRRALAAGTASRWIYVYSGLLGLGATLLSALLPAVMALRRPIADATRSQLERGARLLAGRFALASLPTLGLAAALLLLAPRSLTAAFVALFFVLAAGAMLVPLATQQLMRILEIPLGRLAGLPGHMAARGVTDSLSRTGVATAALTVAVATVVSIGLMIGSFRTSLVAWIDLTTTADLYVDIDTDFAARIEPTLAAILDLPAVEGISRMRNARVPTPAGDINLRAQAPGPEGYGIEIVAPAGATAESLLAGQASLLIAEPLAWRLGYSPGDELALPASNGRERFTIAGIYRDYNTAGSEIVMALDTYRTAFDDEGLTNIGVHIRRDADEDTVIAQVREAFGPGQRPRIRPTGQIRSLSLMIFDRTFQITEVLRLLAGIVAFLGVLSAVMALQLEREREFAVLRSLGMSIRQLFGQNLAQTGLLGLSAGLAAVPLGIALAWLLVHVINRRSFGWSIDFLVAPGSLLAGLAMAIVAALLAGIYPALVGARADMGLAWRDD